MNGTMNVNRIASRDIATIAMSFLAVGVVLMAASGQIPATWLPTPPDTVIAAIPHLNVGISLAAMAAIGSGWRAIRRGRVNHHRAAMVGATLLFTTFLILYLYRLIILGGPSPFTGPDIVYRFLYLPILTIHIVLAIVAIPLVFDAIALAITVPRHRLGATRHPRVGRLAASLWIVSFGLGITVYFLLHWW